LQSAYDRPSSANSHQQPACGSSALQVPCPVVPHASIVGPRGAKHRPTLSEERVHNCSLSHDSAPIAIASLQNWLPFCTSASRSRPADTS
jgi:hypothetical protein